MATKSQKSERRWKVLVAILLYNAFWGIAIFVAFIKGFDVHKMDVISGALFGSSVVSIVGNWMSKPIDDDKENHA